MNELEEYYNSLIQDKESEILSYNWLYIIVDLFTVALKDYGSVDYMILREPMKEPDEEPIPDNFFLLTLWLIKFPFKKLFDKLLNKVSIEHPKEILVISLNNKYNIQFDVESLFFKIYELREIDLVYWKFVEPQSQKIIRAYKENEK